MKKTWQCSIFTLNDKEEPSRKVIYGANIDQVRENIFVWLTEEEPWFYSHAYPNYEYGYYRTENNTSIIPSNLLTQHQNLQTSHGYVGVNRVNKNTPQLDNYSPEDAAFHFLSQYARIVRGPEWMNPTTVDGNFPLHEIKVIKRVTQDWQIKELTQRGWFLLDIEKRHRGPDEYQVCFVLGHMDENAEKTMAEQPVKTGSSTIVHSGAKDYSKR
ncbi:MAG: hypothetical protein AAGB12_07070 [Pseudomonadota bacterium]